MNLSFLKLRVADCPWILFDASAMVRNKDTGTLKPDWASVAQAICGRSRGASAEGIILADSARDGQHLEAWSRNGSQCSLSPTAALCAARWLFDAGRASRDSEVLVIDSRNFGLGIGMPESPGGGSLLETLGGLRLGTSVGKGLGILVPVSIGGYDINAVLFDSPPPLSYSDRLKATRSSGESSIEVLVVSRAELRLKRGRSDPILAAAAALAAAVAVDVADREVVVTTGGDRLVAQWPEHGPVFVAAAPSYCLSGEFWAEDRV
ncbi:MAG: hypothetical protein RBT62_04105 [Spirochaetia bacterium]|nr:hypothetical protein [Spirochaetia bacterium]